MKEMSQRVESNLWPRVFCSGDRVTQIQVKGLGLKGPLPQNFNQLSMLCNLGFQMNHFNGKLSSSRRLSELQLTFFDYNKVDTTLVDFFDGLTSIRILAPDDNPFNGTIGLHYLQGQLESYQSPKPKRQNGISLARTLLAVSLVSPAMAPAGTAQTAAKEFS